MSRSTNNNIIIFSIFCLIALVLSVYIFYITKEKYVYYLAAGLLVLQFFSILYGVFSRIASYTLSKTYNSKYLEWSSYATGLKSVASVYKSLGIWVDLEK